MTGSYVLQPQTRLAGQSGHVGDHDNLGAVLAGNSGVVFNALNTTYSGGADPTGASDCTAAFQACLTAMIAFGGAIMYVPAGSYRQDSQVAWNSSKSLTLVGDGPGATVILLNTSTPTSTTYWLITNSARVDIRNLSMNNNVNASSFSDVNVAVELSSVTWGCFRNVTMQTAAASNRMNQNIVLSNCTNIDIDACDLRSYVNCVVLSGSTAAVTIRAGSFGQNSGSGVSTAASILVTGDPQTLHVTNQVANSGDRGLLCTGGSGANPAFIWLYDYELNNMQINGLDFETGAEVWVTACWIATNSVVNAASSVKVGSSFAGVAHFVQCTFQGAPGHNVQLDGGSGYSFTGCVFGTTAKGSSNFFDELNIQGSVSWVTVDGCHFNTDPYYGIGSTPPRAAVYISSGATHVYTKGCTSLPNGSYGTAALVNNAGSMTESPVNNV